MSKERDSKKPQRDKPPAERVGVQRKIRAFLRALAAGGGKPRRHVRRWPVLQSSVWVDLPDADVAERTITYDKTHLH